MAKGPIGAQQGALVRGKSTTRSLAARFQLAFARWNCAMRRARERFLAKSGIRHSRVIGKRIAVTQLRWTKRVTLKLAQGSTP
jgi:hypothetical protein